jgi:hypothetical protein
MSPRALCTSVASLFVSRVSISFTWWCFRVSSNSPESMKSESLLAFRFWRCLSQLPVCVSVQSCKRVELVMLPLDNVPDWFI